MGTAIGLFEASGTTIQTVNYQTGVYVACSTVMPEDDTIPQNTEGNEVMTLAITPTSATNKLKIDVLVTGYLSNNVMSMGLFQDSTASALAAVSAGQYGAPSDTTKLTHYMTAGTTSSTTFKVRCGVNSASTFEFNGLNGGRKFGGVAASSITITEIKV